MKLSCYARFVLFEISIHWQIWHSVLVREVHDNESDVFICAPWGLERLSHFRQCQRRDYLP
jgi:hypothetical protein